MVANSLLLKMSCLEMIKIWSVRDFGEEEMIRKK